MIIKKRKVIKKNFIRQIVRRKKLKMRSKKLKQKYKKINRQIIKKTKMQRINVYFSDIILIISKPINNI